jgi:hypothetical protein
MATAFARMGIRENCSISEDLSIILNQKTRIQMEKPTDILVKKRNEEMNITGRMHIKIWNPSTGEIKCDEWGPNLVVTTGKNHVADQMSDQGEAAMSHMAVGTGTTAAALGDTALETELDRNALTSTTQGAGGDANKVTYSGDWPPGDGTGAITEAGIFNSASSGTMLCRRVFAVKNKGAADSLSITWEISFN